MAAGSAYRTRQRTAILAYFKEHPHTHVTADELIQKLHSSGILVGRSTVYRTLDRLVEAGTVRKFVSAPGEGACYQFSVGDTSACQSHFHLKCLVCGTLYHVGCDHLQELIDHLGEKHNFSVDYAKTVLLGTCEPCRRALSAGGDLHS